MPQSFKERLSAFFLKTKKKKYGKGYLEKKWNNLIKGIKTLLENANRKKMAWYTRILN